ncbi:DUF2851 family protein [Algoriphagus machipongonensis]|uniref:DUF2851 domain-containing protein n=1 Tax=Algoriphagus machipongonensis TaxID=388413 RepID=A3HVU0_9BACT|nr:DUF2851 family protein [Algoriphagus machipongonensis]EAZ82262.1 hypothetical protein ALPR1_03435 [Algoriphagus machipongonensis]
MDFKEDFLQLVWKYQYFDKKGLQSVAGEKVSVIQIGFHNLGEGPDFLDSVIEVDGVKLHGHVEVHKFASDWKNHAHGNNPAYNSVILHVVWENDQKVDRNDGTSMPTLELKGKIFLNVWRNYEKLLDYQADLPCAYAVRNVPEIVRFSSLEKALVERLHEKSELILKLLEESKGDWEETAYQWLFTCFGFKTNATPMLTLSKKVPYKILQKHRNQLGHLEALLFGQAGLLPKESEEPYVQYLIKEFDFFQKKYRWNNSMTRQEWSFMGARPSNFPSLRIAQLAAILSKAPSLFQVVMEESKDFISFKKILQVGPSDYWKYHFSFGKSASKQVSKGVSSTALQLLIINYVTPLWFAYGRYFQQSEWQERCFDLLQEIPSEKNNIIRKFQNVHWQASNSFDTQGMIGLYKNYCQAKKCLQCKIAQSLIKSESE